MNGVLGQRHHLKAEMNRNEFQQSILLILNRMLVDMVVDIHKHFPFNRDLLTPSPPFEPLLVTQAASVVLSPPSSISRPHLYRLPTS